MIVCAGLAVVFGTALWGNSSLDAASERRYLARNADSQNPETSAQSDATAKARQSGGVEPAEGSRSDEGIGPDDLGARIWSTDSIVRSHGFATAAPEGFAQEAIETGGFEDVLVSNDGSVIGMVCTGSASSLFDRLSAELVDKEWQAVESGQENVRTFVKSRGRYTWLMLSCFQSGEWASATAIVR